MSTPVILAAEQFYSHPRGHWHHLPAALWCWEKHPIPLWERQMIGELPRLGQTDDTITTFAYVNHGRWVAECPFCRNAQVAAKSDHRFLCAGEGACGNVPVGGAFVRVVWPKDHAAIDAELVKRPLPANRNWHPGETVKDLHRENVEHGVAV